jgi:lipopolysaccharide transport system permease protein
MNQIARNSFYELAQHCRTNAVLISELTRRSFRDRYAGQILGRVWMFVHPILIIGIYVFLFSAVFQARVGVDSHLPAFQFYILSGLIPWLCTTETLGKGPVLITSQASLVKQVVFPLEVLPLVNVMSAMVTQFVMLASLLIVSMFVSPPTWVGLALLLPCLTMQVFMLTGFSYGLSAVGVYLRDLKDIVQVTLAIGIYLAPIVYQEQLIPEQLRFLLYLNPFSYMTWCFQDALYYGSVQNRSAWIGFFIFSMATFLTGYKTFRRVRPYFGSVL